MAPILPHDFLLPEAEIPSKSETTSLEALDRKAGLTQEQKREMRAQLAFNLALNVDKVGHPRHKSVVVRRVNGRHRVLSGRRGSFFVGERTVPTGRYGVPVGVGPLRTKKLPRRPATRLYRWNHRSSARSNSSADGKTVIAVDAATFCGEGRPPLPRQAREAEARAFPTPARQPRSRCLKVHR